MQEMSRKNQHFTDSVIRRMTRISYACGAINLAQGFPDFDPPKALTDRLAEVSSIGPHQYPITMGAPNFRQALARKCGRFMGRTLNPDTDMVVTIGSTEAMVDTLFALTNPGDKVVLFSPYFENYRAQIIMTDCEPVFVPIVDDYYKGMASSVSYHAEMLNGNADAEKIYEVLSTHYAGEKFVTVRFSDGSEKLEANYNIGTNKLEITVCGAGRDTLVTSRFDNLGKGASGAAVQNMNIVLGFSEDAGI